MKKFYSFLFAAVALVGFTACNSDSTEDQPAPEQVGKMEFTANIGEDTKTELMEGNKVKWCSTDAIAVSDGTNVEKYTIKELTNDGKTAIFEGKALEGNNFYAVYPWKDDAAYSEGKWNVMPPTEQSAKAGSFADGAAVSYGTYNGDYNFSFTNECAVLKFQVPAACELVEFYNGEDLVVKVVGEMTAEGTYYATLAPDTYTFTVRIDACLSKKSEKDLDLEKNTIYNIKELPAKQTTTVNLVPGIWTSAGAWFAAYYYNGSSNKMVKMTDSDNDGAYTAEVAADAEKVIFVRMDPEKTELAWESMWNQTGNLTLPTDEKTYFHIKPDWTDGGWLANGDKLKYFYLKDPNKYWDNTNAIFRAWVWGNGITDQWVSAGSKNGDYFVFEDKGASDLIFLRANSGSSGWDGEWGRIQTKMPTDWKNCYTLTSYGSGTWSHI